jgi:hypothetical protein
VPFDLPLLIRRRRSAGSAPPPPLALGDLTDVTLTDPINGEELVFDGSKWINY